ncbi:MAG: hypothetical protein ACE368_14765 [Paracoccaceae bacterium]
MRPSADRRGTPTQVLSDPDVIRAYLGDDDD